MEPPAERLLALLLFQQLSQHPPQDEVVDDDKIFSLPLPPPIQCSSSLCSGNTELFATSTGKSLSFQQMWRYSTELHEQDVFCRPSAAPVECSEYAGDYSSYLGTIEELHTASFETILAPLPLQQLSQEQPNNEDDGETVTQFCLRAPVRECSGVDPQKLFVVSTSIDETSFNEAKSVLVCNNR